MTALNKQALRERYSSQPVPKCHICGAEMTIQRAGVGSLVYGCTGRVDSDGEGYVFAEGRDFADNHYALSRVTVANDSDPDVLAMLDELEAKDKSIVFLKDQLAQLENFNPDWDKLEAATDSIREHIAKLSAAEKRIAELEARTVKLPSLNPKMFNDAVVFGYRKAQKEAVEFCAAAGIRIAVDGE